MAADEPGDLEISIRGVASLPQDDGSLRLSISTSRGELEGILHPCEGQPGAVIFVGGAIGGLDGPAHRMYPRLAAELVSSKDLSGRSSLRLHYRRPGEFEECVLDVLAAVSFLKGIGATNVALVGHSFGAAVVIKAGELSDAVDRVAGLSSQLYGTRTVERLASRSLLLVHGSADAVLDAEASRDIYARAVEPKRLVIYEGADHSLKQCAEELATLLLDWLRPAAQAPASSGTSSG